MANTRTNRPVIRLADYIPPDRFRTVENFDMHRAPSELCVELELNKLFMDKLSFSVPWDGKLYAYTRPLPEFLILCEKSGINVGLPITLYLQDWDKKFLLAIENSDCERCEESTFFVPSADVRELLENCCRIEGQKMKKHS